MSGKSYLFRYRAYNVFGWGDWSDAGQVIAAAKPEIVESITVSLQDTNVKLSWSANTVANGSPITVFDI